VNLAHKSVTGENDILCYTYDHKNGGKFPQGIYNIGCNLLIMGPYQQRVPQYMQPGVILVFDSSILLEDIKETMDMIAQPINV
jgi:hypothetical protein